MIWVLLHKISSLAWLPLYRGVRAFVACPNVQLKWAKAHAPRVLHHNQMFDVIIEKSDCDVNDLIMMQKARGLLAHLNWACGQGNVGFLTKHMARWKIILLLPS